MHIGRKSSNCPTLYANGKVLENVDELSYLGDTVAGNGRNGSNIKSRVSKGIGYISEIFNILDNVCFGSHYFKMALLLREAFLVNGALVNAEIWYNLTLKDIQEIENLDRVFFSRLLGIPKTAPIESYYLELGVYNLEVSLSQDVLFIIII